MVIATSAKALLIATVAALSLWRVATADPAGPAFAFRASIHESQVFLTLTLPAICVRLTAHLADEPMNLSAVAWCERCDTGPAGRLWS